MKQFLLLFWFLACPVLAHCQERYRTSEGKIHFNASTPLEDIDATNTRVNAILTSTGDFASVLLIKDFQFRRKLMQEHFNENFMESATYPKASYRGTIEGFSFDAIGSGPSEMRIDGKLTIHGVTRDMATRVSLQKDGQTIKMVSEFILRPEDYNIEVPSILFNKIAEEVAVDISYMLEAETPPEN